MFSPTFAPPQLTHLRERFLPYLQLSLWFDESSGTAKNWSRHGSARDFTAVNSPGTASGVSSATNTARQCDRAAASHFAWSGTSWYSYPMTTSFWFRCSSFDVWGEFLFYFGDISGNNYLVGRAYSTGIEITKSASGGGTNTNLAASLSADTWYMFSVVDASATDRRLYLNAGSEVQSTVSQNSVTYPRMYFGGEGLFGNVSRARLDSAVMLSKALTVEELQILYNAGPGIQIGA